MFFKSRKHKLSQPPMPLHVPIDDTDHESTIKNLLEEAQNKAMSLETGATFTIQVAIPTTIHYMEIVGPIMMRAGGYGLLPGACFNGQFEFTKL